MPFIKIRLSVLVGLTAFLMSTPQAFSQDSKTEAAESQAMAEVTKIEKPESPLSKWPVTEPYKRRDVGSYEVPTTTLNPQQPDTDEWQFQFTPYFWIVGITGQAGIGDVAVDVESGLTDSDVHLNFGFMGTFEARKGRWIILTDLQYSNLGTERPRPRAILFDSAEAEFKTFILDPEIGYRIFRNTAKGHSLDVLGGIRYWHLRADITLNSNIVASRFATRSKDWVDVVGGVRGKAHLTPKFFVVGKGDLGGGGSEFTYQLFGGAGYQFNRTFSVIGGYRHLSVDYDKDNFLFDMALHGPLFGIGIRF